MNIAFPAFLILVIIMPGIVFRRAALVSQAFRDRLSLPDEIGLSLITTLCLHGLWYFLAWLLSGLTGYRVDPTSTVLLLAGRFGSSQERYIDAVRALSDHVPQVGFYFGTLVLFAWSSGFAWRYLSAPVRSGRKALSDWLHAQAWFNNDWIPHPGGTGRSAFQLAEALDHRDDFTSEASNRRFGQWLRSCEIPPEAEELLGSTYYVRPIVAAVVELGGKPFLFRGFLDRAFFSADGELERVTLTDVRRRCIGDDEVDANRLATPQNPEADQDDEDSKERDLLDRYYSVRGQTFILRIPETKTINFDFWIYAPPESED